MRSSRQQPEAESGELNVVPYLDILMNLIIFMLLSMAGLATYGMVNINAPRTTPPGLGQALPDLSLSVAVAKTGFFIATSSDSLTIPLKEGRYDFDALTSKLEELKSRFPGESKVVIAADADTDYDSLVATVDAARETRARKRLFPDVTLAHF